MGGRKTYSVKNVIGKGLGKFKKPLIDSILNQNATDIAITTTKIAVENKKQKKEFIKTISLLRYVAQPSLKEKLSSKLSKELKILSKKYGVESKPLDKNEKKYLSVALSRKRRHKK